MTTIHLGFDMGIRNLAYCMIRHDESVKTVLAWDNVDLLEGGKSAQYAKACVGCDAAAKWIQADGKKWCNACATQKRVKKTARAKPEFPTVPCKLGVGPLRTLVGAEARAWKKDALIAWATARYLLPWKPSKAMDTSLLDIRRAMNTWLDSVLPTFASSTLIRLENQPVMKGPTMKSVQIMLFTLLGHRLEKEHAWRGAIEFVHAGTKTRGAAAAVAEATDESKAYRARKNAAETEVAELLTAAGERGATWLAFFRGRSKRSDLADAFLMAHRGGG